MVFDIMLHDERGGVEIQIEYNPDGNVEGITIDGKNPEGYAAVLVEINDQKIQEEAMWQANNDRTEKLISDLEA